MKLPKKPIRDKSWENVQYIRPEPSDGYTATYDEAEWDGLSDADKLYKANSTGSRSVLINKVIKLRERIEDWSAKYGYENLDNHEERMDKEGVTIWRRTDWEFVDDEHNNLVNSTTYRPTPKKLREFNRLWKHYKLYE